MNGAATATQHRQLLTKVPASSLFAAELSAHEAQPRCKGSLLTRGDSAPLAQTDRRISTCPFSRIISTTNPHELPDNSFKWQGAARAPQHPFVVHALPCKGLAFPVLQGHTLIPCPCDGIEHSLTTRRQRERRFYTPQLKGVIAELWGWAWLPVLKAGKKGNVTKRHFRRDSSKELLLSSKI